MAFQTQISLLFVVVEIHFKDHEHFHPVYVFIWKIKACNYGTVDNNEIREYVDETARLKMRLTWKTRNMVSTKEEN